MDRWIEYEHELLNEFSNENRLTGSESLIYKTNILKLMSGFVLNM